MTGKTWQGCWSHQTTYQWQPEQLCSQTLSPHTPWYIIHHRDRQYGCGESKQTQRQQQRWDIFVMSVPWEMLLGNLLLYIPQIHSNKAIFLSSKLSFCHRSYLSVIEAIFLSSKLSFCHRSYLSVIEVLFQIFNYCCQETPEKVTFEYVLGTLGRKRTQWPNSHIVACNGQHSAAGSVNQPLSPHGHCKSPQNPSAGFIEGGKHQRTVLLFPRG
jgi:hypothetical protein